MNKLLTLCLFFWLSANAIANDAINTVLDNYHQAAAKADFDGYLGAMANESVFIGTDASERWTKKAFASFVQPYFDKGIGWEYQPFDRNLTLLADGKTAYFDELLNNSSYGVCRGTGVVIFAQERWQIVQYSLSIPIPNSIAKSVVKLIAESAQKVNINE
ncbi:nuclear transport factor 2 family protein [Thalassotalea sp. M1531]|uniref:Nuclear transport factor 2 family protein n=1 Tax=Thalassotalea algicola TaxID=2716224 RepID=A0A7Y0LFJ0_9GAMM|nr:nuclear transport factor 2 family protein [Thalassotalea algicola]NMP33549.1 nuclear transport factor 2 family protein [Thalassotalea algicola]